MEKAKKRFASALDGLRSLHSKQEIAVDERIQPEHTAFAKIVRHGFPDDARCIAHDPVQKLIAIGTGHGLVRVLGDVGVDYVLRHEGDHAVLHMQFLVNEGGLITACSNDMVHLWNFRQKKAEIVHSMQLNKESVTCIHLPLQSKWLFVGTDKGNVYSVSVGTFQMSSYVINWNKAIDLSCRVHPGSVRQMHASPTDSSRLLLVFEKGVAVIWNLATREAERFPLDPPVKCASWHYDGRQVMCGNVDGSVSIYNSRKVSEPIQRSTPHGQGPCRPIHQIEWRHSNDGEPLIIFSGGMPTDDGVSMPALTLLRAARSATVLEMDNPILGFLSVPTVPFPSCPQQPHALVVLLKGDIMYIDLVKENYPCLESPHAMDLHESPVTAIAYLSDCPSDLIAALTLVGCKQRKKGFSDRKWPLTGGVGRECATGYQELILTGHKDGMVRFWQASGEHMQILYRLKAGSHFERLENGEQLKDVSLAIHSLHLCPQSRLLLVCGSSGQSTLFRFVKNESMNTIAVVNLPLLVSSPAAGGSTGSDDRPGPSPCREMRRQRKLDSRDTDMSTETEGDEEENLLFPFKVRGAPVRRPAGYQPEVACLLPWSSPSQPPSLQCAALNSAFGVLAIATNAGLALVDINQCALIYAWTTSELYGSEPTPAVQLGPLGGPPESAGPTLGAEPSPFWTSPPLSPRPPSAGSTTSFRSPSSCSARVEVEDACQGNAARVPQRTRTFHAGATTGGKSVVGIFRRNTAELAASARQRFQGKTMRDETIDAVADTEKAVSSPETPDRPPLSSHHQSNGNKPPAKIGLMRRLTSKKKVVVRSNSFDEQSGEGETAQGAATGDSSREPYCSAVSRVSASSPTSSQQSFDRSQPKTDRDDEYVTSLCFIHSTSRKNDGRAGPSLWVGTSAGACIALALLLPTDRLSSTVVVAPSGTLIKMRGEVLQTAFMDSSFCLLGAASEAFRETSKESPDSPQIMNRVRTKATISPTLSTSIDGESGNQNGVANEMTQILVCVSEWEVRVVALPSLSQLFHHRCDEIPLVKASATHVRGQPVLWAITAAGQQLLLSLPSLRPLLLQQFFPHSVESDDPVIHKTIFSENGLGVYMPSPSEVEKYTVCAEIADQVDDSLGELFVPVDMPEQPKQQGLLKGGLTAFFSVNNRQETVDLDTLLCDKDKPPSAATAMRSVARTIPGPATSMERAHGSGVSAGLAAQMALQNLSERGERLNQVVDATENLRNSAQNLSSRTGKLVEKYEKKKWYNF